jgi:hypothetical protein
MKIKYIKQARSAPVPDIEKWLGQPSYHDGFGRSPDLWSLVQIKVAVTAMLHTPTAQSAPVQEPEHLQQGVDALVSAAGTALEVLEKHRQIKGEAPMGMLGVRAIEELKEAFGLLHPQDDYEPPAQPAVPDV